MAKKAILQNQNKPGDFAEKQKAIEAAQLQIEKQFGKGSLMKLGARAQDLNIEVIPTGSILLDAALGVGGYPKGRIIFYRRGTCP
jgi:recombination protein RecA